MSDLLDSLIERRALLANTLEGSLAHARDIEGRSSANSTELALMADIRGLNEHIDSLGDDAIRGDFSALSSRINGTPSSTRKTAMNDSRNLTYRRGDHRTSWIRDLVLTQTGRDDSGECSRRLAEHGQQVASDPAYQEHRDLSRVDGQGGYASPPAWLLSEYVTLARAGRPFADICSTMPLPSGTDSINIPKILTGTTLGIQPSDNTELSSFGGETDLTDTFINAPVRTIAGQQGVSIQLLDQSPISFDEVIFQDLIAAHAAVLDGQVLAGTGSSGQVLGVDFTPNIQTVALSGSPTIATFYSAVAHSIGLVHSTRFLPPTHIVVTPLRWAWMLSLLDSTNRPLFVPRANMPMNAAGLENGVISQGIVGEMAGLPIVVDPNLPETGGGGTGAGTDDVAYVLRSPDLLLWEGAIRARVLPEVRATSLTVLLQVFSYLAFSASRYPQSIVQLTGLSEPTF